MKLLLKTLQTLVLILLSAILVCNLYLIAAKTILHQNNPTIFGWSWAIVVTGSMEPAISGNDVVVAKVQADYTVGDIIMFESGSMQVTHRIVEETGEGFITKGDANNTEDSAPVTREHILGKIVFTIPAIGAALRFLRTPLGMLCLVLIGFLSIEVPYFLEDRKNEQNERRK